MKKLILILLIAVMFLSGCTKGQQPNEPNGNRVAQNTSAPSASSNSSSSTPAVTPTQEPTAVPTKESTPQPETNPPKPQDTLLVKMQTTILDASENRVTNIKLCANVLNGHLIKPGEQFSFNAVVGPRTAEKGYKKAPVIIEKKKEYDYGGGVCQVSSTLYKAAFDLGLQIQERHEHGKPVGYIQQGFDAAVSYNGYDLKFTNNTDFTLKIKTSVGKYVTVSLYRVPNE